MNTLKLSFKGLRNRLVVGLVLVAVGMIWLCAEAWANMSWAG